MNGPRPDEERKNKTQQVVQGWTTGPMNEGKSRDGGGVR